MEIRQDLRDGVRHPLVIAELEDLPALVRRRVHRAPQQLAQQRFPAGRSRPEQDVHEDRTAGRKLARPERLGLAVVCDYLAEFILLIQVHDIAARIVLDYTQTTDFRQPNTDANFL